MSAPRKDALDALDAPTAAELAMQARTREAASWHRCWRCFHAPCTCPPGEGLGRVLWAGGGAAAPVQSAKAKKTRAPRTKRVPRDPEQVWPGDFGRGR